MSTTPRAGSAAAWVAGAATQAGVRRVAPEITDAIFAGHRRRGSVRLTASRLLHHEVLERFGDVGAPLPGGGLPLVRARGRASQRAR